jgi:predicted transcriptional regulator
MVDSWPDIDKLRNRSYAGLVNMQVPPELEAKLTRLAAETGRTVDQVAVDLLTTSMDHDEWFRAEVEKGRTAAKAGCSSTMTLLPAWIADIAADARPRDHGCSRRSRTNLRLHGLGRPDSAGRVAEPAVERIGELSTFPRIVAARRTER